MLPSSIRTFWSFTHAPSTPLSVLVARATAWFMASSKPVSEVALNSVTGQHSYVSLSPLPSLPPSYLWPNRANIKHEGRESKDLIQGKACELGVCPNHSQGIYPRNGELSCLGRKEKTKMAKCEVCGNEYDKAFQISMPGEGTPTPRQLRVCDSRARAIVRVLRRQGDWTRCRGRGSLLLLRPLREYGRYGRRLGPLLRA